MEKPIYKQLTRQDVLLDQAQRLGNSVEKLTDEQFDIVFHAINTIILRAHRPKKTPIGVPKDTFWTLLKLLVHVFWSETIDNELLDTMNMRTASDEAKAHLIKVLQK